MLSLPSRTHGGLYIGETDLANRPKDPSTARKRARKIWQDKNLVVSLLGVAPNRLANPLLDTLQKAYTDERQGSTNGDLSGSAGHIPTAWG